MLETQFKEVRFHLLIQCQGEGFLLRACIAASVCENKEFRSRIRDNLQLLHRAGHFVAGDGRQDGVSGARNSGNTDESQEAQNENRQGE